MTDEDQNRLLDQIKQDEGCVLHAYQDSLGSRNVSPNFPTSDALDGLSAHPVFPTELCVGSALIGNGPYLHYLASRKSGVVVVFPKGMRKREFRPMFYGIKLIGFARIPSQIFDVVIEGIAVIVATLHAIWAWANKCEQHQSVNSHCESDAVQFGEYKQPNGFPILKSSAWLKDTARFPDHCSDRSARSVKPEGSNQSSRACLIAWKSWDIAPFHGLYFT